MNSAFTLLICALCFLFCFHSVHSMQCYSCLSATNTDCKDPFTGSSSVSTCEGPQCYKTVTTTASGSVVFRVCTTGTELPNKCESNTNDGGVTVTQCICSSDLCNSAHTNRSMSPVLWLLVSLFMMTIIAVVSCRE